MSSAQLRDAPPFTDEQLSMLGQVFIQDLCNDWATQPEMAGKALDPDQPRPDALERARRVDLITLPDGTSGTNCGNCQFNPAGGYCVHPEIDQPVTDRNCCAEWDAPGTGRAWETGKEKALKAGPFRDQGGESAPQPADWGGDGLRAPDDVWEAADRSPEVVGQTPAGEVFGTTGDESADAA